MEEIDVKCRFPKWKDGEKQDRSKVERANRKKILWQKKKSLKLKEQ